MSFHMMSSQMISKIAAHKNNALAVGFTLLFLMLLWIPITIISAGIPNTTNSNNHFIARIAIIIPTTVVETNVVTPPTWTVIFTTSDKQRAIPMIIIMVAPATCQKLTAIFSSNPTMKLKNCSPKKWFIRNNIILPPLKHSFSI